MGPGQAASPWRARLLAALASGALALAVVAPLVWRRFQGRGEELVLRPLPEIPARTEGPLAPVSAGRPEPVTFSEEVAAALYPSQMELAVYDPYCGFLRQPRLELPKRWKEHPAGGWMMRTNSLGLREDSEPMPDPVELRVLVTGDSHTEGVCAQAESFANVLEARLRERYPWECLDVLNAGKGSYSFWNYLGVLERFLELGLRPHVFVVAVFGGNDFDGDVPVHLYFRDRRMPAPGPDWKPRIDAALGVSKYALAQSLLAPAFFAEHPDLWALALEGAREVMVRAAAVCRAEGVRLVVLYIPAPHEVEPANPALRLPAMMEALGLDDADLRSTTALTEAFLAALAEERIETLDLRPSFRAVAAGGGTSYWAEDLHIRTEAHARIAQELERFLLGTPGEEPASAADLAARTGAAASR